jgi:rhodanese-related sulfurtransferase
MRHEARVPEVTRVSPEEAHAKLQDGYVYVDVRSEPEFAEGHPSGAYNVPLMHMGSDGMTPNPDFLTVMKRRFASDARLVLGCKGGARSLRAARLLLAEGFVDVVDQRAGWSGAADPFGKITEPGWSRVGLPTETGAPEGRSFAHLKTAT